MPNIVKPSLPPESAQWGRSVEERLKESSLIARNLGTLIHGVRANLSSLTGVVGFLSDQTRSVETTPSTVTSVMAELTSPDDNQYIYYSFEPGRDAEVVFTTSGTGKIMYQAGGWLGADSYSYATAETTIGVRIYKGRDALPENSVLYAWNGGATIRLRNHNLSQTLAATGHLHSLTLEPRTEYVARTFRGWRFTYQTDVGGTQNATSFWQGASLSITKIGK